MIRSAVAIAFLAAGADCGRPARRAGCSALSATAAVAASPVGNEHVAVGGRRDPAAGPTRLGRSRCVHLRAGRDSNDPGTAARQARSCVQRVTSVVAAARKHDYARAVNLAEQACADRRQAGRCTLHQHPVRQLRHQCLFGGAHGRYRVSGPHRSAPAIVCAVLIAQFPHLRLCLRAPPEGGRTAAHKMCPCSSLGNHHGDAQACVMADGQVPGSDPWLAAAAATVPLTSSIGPRVRRAARQHRSSAARAGRRGPWPAPPWRRSRPGERAGCPRSLSANSLAASAGDRPRACSSRDISATSTPMPTIMR